MLKMNNPQIDFISAEVYKHMIPENHFLVQVDKYIDFGFILDILIDNYSSFGRGSYDCIMMSKIALLQYIYQLSDPAMEARLQTDVAFKWFLGLNISDPVPDETTICRFRTERLGKENLQKIFDHYVKACIDLKLVTGRRMIADTTDVAANASFPFKKKLLRQAIEYLAKEIDSVSPQIAKELLDRFQFEIDEINNAATDKVRSKTHFEAASKILDVFAPSIFVFFPSHQPLKEAYEFCLELIEDYLIADKDKIRSVVDRDARAAHKSARNIKCGFKNHIMADEDSEIIVSSHQTPFNVGDELGLQPLVDQSPIKPDEISTDKVYGSYENRVFLAERGIQSNIKPYDKSSKPTKYYGMYDFNIAEDMKSVICPYGITTSNFHERFSKKTQFNILRFKFDMANCKDCPLREKCLPPDRKGARSLEIDERYKVLKEDLKRMDTEEFTTAMNRRFIVERRFATLVRNHGLRRSRYIGMERTSIHIMLANLACNIKRMVVLLARSNLVMQKT